MHYNQAYVFSVLNQEDYIYLLRFSMQKKIEYDLEKVTIVQHILDGFVRSCDRNSVFFHLNRRCVFVPKKPLQGQIVSVASVSSKH